MEQVPPQGGLRIEVPCQSKQTHSTREAKPLIRYDQVFLHPPPNRTKNKDGFLENLRVSAIYVTELDPPEGEKPLEWMLLTNYSIHDLEEALEKVNWYRSRWHIENYHKVLKSGKSIW